MKTLDYRHLLLIICITLPGCGNPAFYWKHSSKSMDNFSADVEDCKNNYTEVTCFTLPEKTIIECKSYSGKTVCENVTIRASKHCSTNKGVCMRKRHGWSSYDKPCNGCFEAAPFSYRELGAYSREIMEWTIEISASSENSRRTNCRLIKIQSEYKQNVSKRDSLHRITSFRQYDYPRSGQ